MKKAFFAATIAVAVMSCNSGSKLSPKDIVGVYSGEIISEIPVNSMDSMALMTNEFLSTIQSTYDFQPDGTLINTIFMPGDTSEVIIQWNVRNDSLVFKENNYVEIVLPITKTETGIDIVGQEVTHRLTKVK